MKFIISFLTYIYSFFCSLKLAIFTLSALALLFAVGTFYESARGTQAAGELIYRSFWMTALVSLLALNIIAVMIDRWPWKKRHIAFLLAHFGIIFVIIGSVITKFYGIDGSLRLALEEEGSQIITKPTLLMVYSSFDAKNLTELYREQVYFFRRPPRSDKAHVVKIGSDTLKVTDFYPSALAREQYEPALRGGPALRFQITGSQAQIVKWMFKPPWMDQVKLPLGPAEIILSKTLPLKLDTKNVKNNLNLKVKHSVKQENLKQDNLKQDNLKQENTKEKPQKKKLARLLLAPEGEKLRYRLEKPGSKKLKEGFLQTGLSLHESGIKKDKLLKHKSQKKPNLKKGILDMNHIKTGWMDFEFRLLEYFPKALPNTLFTPQKRVSEQTNSAIQVEFKGEKRWMGLNSHLFFFDEDKVYIVAYINERKNLNFRLRLKNFKVVRYPSSLKATSYESEVQVNQRENIELISMNHPLKLAGYTIYQSGFEEDENRVPVASVFSINKDPGRFVKYFGSFLVVLGCFVLFLRRNLRTRR